MTLTKIIAPWTREQVDTLNFAQGCGYLHPFTCPGDSGDSNKVCRVRELTATVDGWICACGRYRQEWAFDIPPEVLGKVPR
jgi:hypothetical protein